MKGDKRKIFTVIGARPQFIKASMVSREMQKYSDVSEIIVHTGQHFDINMSRVFLSELQMPAPKYNLNINSLSHGSMTGKMIEQIEKILIREQPNWVLVYGDTNSTLAAALAARKQHIKLAHVESGLRSNNMMMPEEINRVVTDRISDLLFCPTEIAVKNLQREGFEYFDCRIVKCGDVMKDSYDYYRKAMLAPSFNLPKQYILATIHRQENTDCRDRLTSIIKGLNAINKQTPIVMPIHPRTKAMLLDYAEIDVQFQLCDPVGYLNILYLISNSSMVITDSGGLQKEAYFFKIPCLVVRNETEWVELVDREFAVLSGSNYDSIYSNYKRVINKNIDFDTNLYGDGKASEIIVKELLQ